jgi:hypothetical protein
MAYRPGISAYRRALVFTVAAFILCREAAAVPVVWTGPTISFSKVGSADPTLPENQDRMTDNVWITRRGPVQGGIYNAAAGETAYVRFSSPADTEWATDAIPDNDGKTISASNWQELAFTPWAEAYGGPGFGLGQNILVKNAVVHLITDDIYLDLMFTQFNSSGLFAYDRSTPAAALPSGDYNQNGVVDAGDYVVWRGTLNQSVSPNGSGADGNSNGTIDAGDYSHWAARFGNLVPTSAAGAGIPEPKSCLLALIVGFANGASYLRRRPARTK